MYRQLPGRSTRFITLASERHELWLAGDHLLHLTTEFYVERPRRYDLKDIQAITITETKTGKYVNTALGLLAGLCLFGAVATEIVSGVFAVLAIVFVAGVVVNAILGPTCTCHLYTALQRYRLVSLGRIRPATRAVEILSERIRAVQGEGA